MNIGTTGLLIALLSAAIWITTKATRTSRNSKLRSTEAIFERPVSAAECEHIDLRQSLRAMAHPGKAPPPHPIMRLDLRLPDDPLTVSVVPGDLQQLLTYILDVASNALREGVTLHVLARVDGCHAVVNWRDAGEEPPRLSRAFDTAVGATAARIEGCRAIAARYGARLYAAPSPLGDCSLTLRFPLQGQRATPVFDGRF